MFVCCSVFVVEFYPIATVLFSVLWLVFRVVTSFVFFVLAVVLFRNKVTVSLLSYSYYYYYYYDFSPQLCAIAARTQWSRIAAPQQTV